ncbi:hypothetical protein LPB140_04765 [Sphingorhabdus lutea]|uniref:TonB-dependent receptor n=1 Tax=Sphingorhabdus lutea TaxID=1913578 RepID=A0A1L3JEN1_9SPHN|nr:TonB-dependent receptor [Sphingorhabdus lutea]APG63590.1 hypothetical protein LPB140_04765 [Sphingorhabdus lutea]
MLKNILQFSAAIAALCPSHALYAQDNADDAEFRGDIIVTATGSESYSHESGQAVTVLDKKDIEQSQQASISDLLRQVPGVAVARSGGVGSQTSVFIRGGESSQTLVLVDGVKINDPSTPNNSFDFGALMTGNLNRVEILRGPNSVIWGSQAIGGVINVQTAPTSEAFEVQAMAEYGSLNSGQARANISGTTGRISGSIGASYYRTDGVSALRTGTERDGYKNFAANGKLGLELTDNIGIDLRGYYNKGRVEFDDPFGATADTYPENENEQFVGYIGLNANLFDGAVKNIFSYTRTDLTRIGTEPNVPFSFNVNILKGAIDRFAYRGSASPHDKIDLNFGVEHESSTASTFFPAGGGAAPNQAETQVTSGYAQAVLRPFTGLTLTGGVRYDDTSDYGDVTTFGANAAYSPNGGNTIFRATYAEGFRAPTLTEALLPFGNAALRPETAKSYDVGVEQNFLGRHATIAATLFKRDSKDAIIYSFVTFQSENVARVRATGAEITLALRPSDRFTINAQYSYVNAQDRTPGVSFGAQLPRRPKHSVNFSADWQTPLGLDIGGDIYVAGDSFNSLPNIYAPTAPRLDGYILAGIRASYPVTDNVEIFGRVDNLFDSDYEVVRRYNVLGRNIFAGVRLKY